MNGTLAIHDVTRAVSDTAAELLRSHELSGHKYAIDATLAAGARGARQPVTVVTSDPADLTSLCGPQLSIRKVQGSPRDDPAPRRTERVTR